MPLLLPLLHATHCIVITVVSTSASNRTCHLVAGSHHLLVPLLAVDHALLVSAALPRGLGPQNRNRGVHLSSELVRLVDGFFGVGSQLLALVSLFSQQLIEVGALAPEHLILLIPGLEIALHVADEPLGLVVAIAGFVLLEVAGHMGVADRHILAGLSRPRWADGPHLAADCAVLLCVSVPGVFTLLVQRNLALGHAVPPAEFLPHLHHLLRVVLSLFELPAHILTPRFLT
mmetsp:Transcript_41918/g.100739  ORF Transcript_41918/g.100739 Transcript_41918/m.100739 type:complete len:231 (-) Transcript_41918:297-989(-)